MNRAGRWGVLLLAASLFLGWETYRAWTSPVDSGATPAAPFSPRQVPAGSRDGDPQDAGVAAEVAAILARPVFRPDRHPYQDNTAGGVSMRNYGAELSRFTLVGVILQGEVKTAVVVGKGSGRSERWEVGPGDALPGFTVRAVDEEGVQLVADDREFLLPMYSGSPKAQDSGPLRTEVSPPPVASRMQPAGNSAASPLQPSMPSASMPQSAPPTAGAMPSPPGGIDQAEILRNRLRMRRTFRPANR